MRLASFSKDLPHIDLWINYQPLHFDNRLKHQWLVNLADQTNHKIEEDQEDKCLMAINNRESLALSLVSSKKVIPLAHYWPRSLSNEQKSNISLRIPFDRIWEIPCK